MSYETGNCSLDSLHSGLKLIQLERAGAEIRTQAFGLLCTTYLTVPGGAVQGSRGLCFSLASVSDPLGFTASIWDLELFASMGL